MSNASAIAVSSRGRHWDWLLLELSWYIKGYTKQTVHVVYLARWRCVHLRELYVRERESVEHHSHPKLSSPTSLYFAVINICGTHRAVPPRWTSRRTIWLLPVQKLPSSKDTTVPLQDQIYSRHSTRTVLFLGPHQDIVPISSKHLLWPFQLLSTLLRLNSKFLRDNRGAR